MTVRNVQMVLISHMTKLQENLSLIVKLVPKVNNQHAQLLCACLLSAIREFVTCSDWMIAMGGFVEVRRLDWSSLNLENLPTDYSKAWHHSHSKVLPAKRVTRDRRLFCACCMTTAKAGDWTVFVRSSTIVVNRIFEVWYLLTMTQLLNCGISVRTWKLLWHITEQMTAKTLVSTPGVYVPCFTPTIPGRYWMFKKW